MQTRSFVLAAAAAIVSAATASAQHITGSGRLERVPAPVKLDGTDRFQDAIARVGDDVFIGGQPTERALRELRAQGVTTVVNLRTPEEMKRDVKFDEPALIAQLGMKYVYLPV